MSDLITSPRGPIVLLTDFGAADGYVGAMKGVILTISPRAQIVDLSHEIPPQDVRAAAFVLGTTHRHFPPGSIFVAVVDPGVGGPRRGIAFGTSRGIFVAPDNGLLSMVLAEPLDRGLRAVALAERRYWASSVSATFHGRDVFAPVAAHLSLGTALEALGPPADDLIRLPFPRPIATGQRVVGEVLHVDRFGNLITNLRLADLAVVGEPSFAIGGTQIAGLRPYYSAGEDLGALVGSSGYVEIALYRGSAAAALQVGVGATVVVTRGAGG